MGECSTTFVFTASSIVRDFGRVEYMSFTFILLEEDCE